MLRFDILISHGGYVMFHKCLSRRHFLVGGTITCSTALTSLTSNGAFAATSSPEEFAAAIEIAKKYLTARTQFGRSTGSSPLRQFISDMCPELLDQEQNRLSVLDDLGAPNRWNGKMQRISSGLDVLSWQLDTNDGVVTVLINETVRLNWRPAPRQASRSALLNAAPEAALVPQKYGLDQPDWPNTDSSWLVTHELRLARERGTYRLISDKYSEPTVSGVSAYGGYELLVPTTDVSLASAAAPATAATNIFDWNAARNYALNWALSYNPAYTNFAPNDCANFVSQAFRAGNYSTDASWYKYSSAWVNNVALRNWLLSSGRGYSQASASLLGYADIINYDWSGDGTFDHVVMVTGLPGPLISSHTTAHRNVPWNLPSSGSPNCKYKFTSTLVYN